MRNAGSGTNSNAFCLCLQFAVVGGSQSHCARLHSFACRQHISVIKVPLSAFGCKRLFDAAYEQPTPPPPPCLGWGVKKACIPCCFVCKMQNKFDLLLSTRKFRPRGSWSKCTTFMLWNMNTSYVQLKAINPLHKRTNTFQGNYLRSELYVGLTWRRNWLRRHSRTCVLHGGDSRPKCSWAFMCVRCSSDISCATHPE